MYSHPPNLSNLNQPRSNTRPCYANHELCERWSARQQTRNRPYHATLKIISACCCTMIWWNRSPVSSAIKQQSEAVEENQKPHCTRSYQNVVHHEADHCINSSHWGLCQANPFAPSGCKVNCKAESSPKDCRPSTEQEEEAQSTSDKYTL